AAGITSGNPVAMGRCAGGAGFCAEGVVAFQNGVLGTVGSNTASNNATTTLAPNKVPTGIAVTNGNEFALVTVWDTATLKGQVAVIALDSCAQAKGGNPLEAWWQPCPGM